jgi:aminoglycoside 6'-N-acetyltransferase
MKQQSPVLRGARVVLRAVQPSDHAALRSFLADPSVAQWWGPPHPDVDVLDDWLENSPDTTVWTIEFDRRVAGSVQASEEGDPDYRHVGIDLFLGPEFQGKGAGTEAIRLLARWLFDERGHHRLTIDPSATNERAIRAYAAVGFKPVGIMRRYERGPDGTFHDGLLMDLLRDEFRESSAG